MGSPGSIHDRTLDCQEVSGALSIDDLTTEGSFNLQAMRVIDVHGLFFLHLNHGCLYNQALADVPATGAGI